jgi:hypothetical protein
MRAAGSSTICILLLLAAAEVAPAEVVRIDVQRRDDWGTHERVIGRVHFAIDPALPANGGIADLDRAPRNAAGKVEFASDVLFFRPKDPRRARGAAFVEVVNRGRDQSLAILSGARQRSLAPESWNLGDGFLLEQGFAVAFLGWQFDVRPVQGLTFTAPVAPVEGLVRDARIELAYAGGVELPLTYCATESGRSSVAVTFRARMDESPRPVPREGWQLSSDGCAVRVASALGTGIYEAVYVAKGSPVAGLGLAAVRDFASYLRHGADGAALRETPSALRRVIGYGYSQSGRFLREFVRDGFNADERGRPAFDALLVASAGAGGGSFNHRFAMPGQAGNSVLSVLRPVDLPPFTDEGLLAKASAAHVTPKIFYTFSSTEYWARAGSLTHTSEDGPFDRAQGRLTDAPLAATSRLYFLAGTPHSTGGLPLSKGRDQYRQFVNFAEQRWVSRALLLELDAWTRGDREPPPSQYPTIARGELVSLEDVRFPKVPSFPFATYMPRVWRLDFGREYRTTRAISIEPPKTGEPFRVLVPQVDTDGNDVAGIRTPEVAVPLGTYTGWNVTIPQLSELRYLSGLVGGFEPFARTREQRSANGDSRLSITERYRGRPDYLDKVRRAANDLVRQRFLRVEDVPAVLQSAERIWGAVVASDPLP